MKNATKTVRTIQKSKRKGVPLIVYLEKQQARKLDRLSKDRLMTKTAIVKFAMERLFTELSNGQLDLPLGLEAGQK